MKTIGCVIVTFNKKQMLMECLDHVLNQDRKVDSIIIVDNCSNDGTEEYIRSLMDKNSRIQCYSLKKNIGGAGGFSFGLKRAYESGLDYIWIMDDDTIPQKSSLSELISVSARSDLDWGFLSSNVRWTDNSACVMNIPTVDKNWSEQTNNGLIGIQSASFVSLLISREVLVQVGYPIKEYFIWGDDVEFTSRISKLKPCYFVPQSIVIHKMKSNKGINIVDEDSDRLGRYFYEFRNRVNTAREQGSREYFSIIIRTFGKVAQLLITRNNFRFKKIFIVLKGFFSGLLFHPEIEMTDGKIKRG